MKMKESVEVKNESEIKKKEIGDVTFMRNNAKKYVDNDEILLNEYLKFIIMKVICRDY